MSFKKHCYNEEFWGAKTILCEYEFIEDYDGQIFDILKEKIENYEIDEIPEELEITAINCLDPECEKYQEKDFVINPYDYLSKENVKELENLLNQLYGENDE